MDIGPGTSAFKFEGEEAGGGGGGTAHLDPDPDPDYDQDTNSIVFDLNDIHTSLNLKGTKEDGAEEEEANDFNLGYSGLGDDDLDSFVVTTTSLDDNDGSSNKKPLGTFSLPQVWKEYPDEFILSGFTLSFILLFILYSIAFCKGFKQLQKCVKLDKEKWKNYKIIVNSNSSANHLNFDLEKSGGYSGDEKADCRNNNSHNNNSDPNRLLDYSPNMDYEYNIDTETTVRNEFTKSNTQGKSNGNGGVLDWISHLRPDLKNPFSNMSPSLAKSKMSMAIATPAVTTAGHLHPNNNNNIDTNSSHNKKGYIDHSLPPVIVPTYSRSGNQSGVTGNPNSSLNYTPSNLLPTQSIKKPQQANSTVVTPTPPIGPGSPDVPQQNPNSQKFSAGSASAAFVTAFYKPFKRLTGRNATTAEIEEEEAAAFVGDHDNDIDNNKIIDEESKFKTPLVTALESFREYNNYIATGSGNGYDLMGDRFSPIKVVQQMISPLSSPRKSTFHFRTQLDSPSIDNLQEIMRAKDGSNRMTLSTSFNVKANSKKTVSARVPKIRYEIDEMFKYEPVELFKTFEDLKGIDMLSLDLFFPKDANFLTDFEQSSTPLKSGSETPRSEGKLMSIEREITYLRKEIISENVDPMVQQISILRLISISNNNLESLGNSIVYLMSYGILIESLVESGLMEKLFANLPFILSRALLEVIICYCNLNWKLNRDLLALNLMQRQVQQEQKEEGEEIHQQQSEPHTSHNNYTAVSKLLNLKFGVRPYLQSDFKIFKLVLQMISLGIQDDFLNKELIYLMSFNDSPHHLIHIYNGTLTKLQSYDNYPTNYPQIDQGFNSMALELVAYLKRQYQSDHCNCCMDRSSKAKSNGGSGNKGIVSTRISTLTRKKLPGSLGHK